MEDSVFVESKKRPDENAEEIVARVKRSREEGGSDDVEEKEAEQGSSAKRVKLAEPQTTGDCNIY